MDKKTIWIIANWKSNKTITEALEWVGQVGPEIPCLPYLKIAVCPTFTAIEEVKKAVLVGNYPLLVGAQDLSEFDNGPYTGEETARILADLVDIAIVGHSERRQNFAETDEMVAEKTKRAKEFQIIPVVCLQNQDTPVPPQAEIVAYEPVFAIGTGNPDTPDNAEKVAKEIKGKNSQDLQVLYGGSVTSGIAKPYLQDSLLNGLLIGGASLDAEEFLKIIDIASKV